MAVQAQVGLCHLPFKIMTLGFEANRFLQKAVDGTNTFVSNGAAEIDMHFGTQAHENLAVRCKPQPVTVVAEIMAHRSN